MAYDASTEVRAALETLDRMERDIVDLRETVKRLGQSVAGHKAAKTRREQQ